MLKCLPTAPQKLLTQHADGPQISSGWSCYELIYTTWWVSYVGVLLHIFLDFYALENFMFFFVPLASAINLYNIFLNWVPSQIIDDLSWIGYWMKKVDPNIYSTTHALCVLRFTFFYNLQVWRILVYLIFVAIFFKPIYND
jgi:hypothetical protein